MPITDEDVGITEILGSHRPFRAVLKQSIDDFVVNEVLLSGKVARLTRLAQVPSHPPGTQRDKIPEAENTKEKAGPFAPEHKPAVSQPEIPFEKLEACFVDDFKKPASELLQKAIQTDATELVLPICNDKQKRKDIHDWVRSHMSGYVTDTVEQEADGKTGQAVRLRKRNSCRPWKRRRAHRTDGSDRPRPDAASNDTFDPREEKALPHKQREKHEVSQQRVGRSTYVQFVLWKRNKDTMEALTVLSKILRVPTSAFTFAGTKDKRAVTTQLVQIRGVSESRLAIANKIMARRDRGYNSMAIGNVEILPQDSPRALGLGDLHGNRFTMALRDLDLRTESDQRNIESAVDSLRIRGFVNYFGLQRFGSGVSGTHETGFAFLRGDFEDVCRRILLPLHTEEWERQGSKGVRPERRRLNTALEQFARKEISAKELLQVLPRWMHIEMALVSSFAHNEDHGLKKYDYRAAFEKLPRNLRRMYGHAVQSYLWNIMASERIRVQRPDGPLRMHAIRGDLVLVDPECSNEVNYETPVRAVTEKEEQEKSVSIFRVVIPVLGSEVALPEDISYGKAAKKTLEAQKIDLKSRVSSDYGMKGTYRALLAKPKDVEMNIVSYSSSSDVLIQSSIIHTLSSGENLPQSERAENRRGDNPGLSGSQNNTTNTGLYKAGQSKYPSIPGKLVSDTDAKIAETVLEPVSEDRKDSMSSVGSKKAMVIAFTLGRGEFATMLVRELTRQESSTANQKAMQEAVLKENGS